MIELVPSELAGSEARLLLRPRRALTARQFTACFLVLAAATWGLAGLGYVFGNVFAPAFALLDTGFVAWAWRWAWREGDRFELIVCDGQALEVRRSRQTAPAFRAHPYWVRLTLCGEAGQARVLLGSQGRQVEVGAFLSPQERRDLAGRLQDLLATASGRGRSPILD